MSVKVGDWIHYNICGVDRLAFVVEAESKCVKVELHEMTYWVDRADVIEFRPPQGKQRSNYEQPASR